MWCRATSRQWCLHKATQAPIVGVTDVAVRGRTLQRLAPARGYGFRLLLHRGALLKRGTRVLLHRMHSCLTTPTAAQPKGRLTPDQQEARDQNNSSPCRGARHSDRSHRGDELLAEARAP